MLVDVFRHFLGGEYRNSFLISARMRDREKEMNMYRNEDFYIVHISFSTHHSQDFSIRCLLPFSVRSLLFTDIHTGLRSAARYKVKRKKNEIRGIEGEFEEKNFLLLGLTQYFSLVYKNERMIRNLILLIIQDD